MREKEKKKRASGRESTPLGKSWNRGEVTVWGGPLHQWLVCGRQDRVKFTLMVCARARWGPAWNGWLYTSENRGRVPKSGIRTEQTQGENSMDRFDGTETAWGEWEWRGPHLGTLLKNAHIALEVRFNCWVAHRGRATTWPLFFHTSAPGFWGVLGRSLNKERMYNLVVILLILPSPMPDQIHVPWSPLLGPLTQIWKHAHTVVELGDKSKLSPRGCVTKEEKLKSLLEAMSSGIKPLWSTWYIQYMQYSCEWLYAFSQLR